MTWKPEGTTSVRESEESRLEWIQRNFRKLSQWSGRWVQQGYGGMYLSETLVLPTPLVLTTTFQQLIYFDTPCSDAPVGIESDLSQSHMRLTEGGVWLLMFEAAGHITPFSSNVGQSIEFASKNETTGVFNTFGHSAIPRDSEVFHSSVTQLRHFRRVAGDWTSLWIRLQNATPSVSVTEIDELEISGCRVGQGYGGIDSTLVTSGILS